MAVETKGPISGNDGVGSTAQAVGQTLRFNTNNGDGFAKGHCSWEFYDQNGALAESGSSKLSGLAEGSILATYDTSSWVDGYSYRLVVTGTHKDVAIGFSNAALATQINGSGNFEATKTLNFLHLNP